MGRPARFKWGLMGFLLGLLVLAEGTLFIPGQLAHGLKWVAGSDLSLRLRGMEVAEHARGEALHKMSVAGVGLSRANHGPIVVLEQREEGRYLPVWIGPAEASAIRRALQGIDMARPLTHDLMSSVIEALEGRVTSVVIHELKNDVFYARITLVADGREVVVDSRPSDAIAIALRVGAPIYAEEAVLDEAGVPLDREQDEPLRLTSSP